MRPVTRTTCWTVLLLTALFSVANVSSLGADEPETKASVELTIDYGDGVKKVFCELPWAKGMTILDALEAAKKHPRGITFKHKGKGATGFLTQIDDLKNQGRGSNWIYRVNDELGETSFAVYKLKAEDAVLWKFGKYR